MELTFVKNVDKWVAEFVVSEAFSLHIEKGNGRLTVLQTTVAGHKPDVVASLCMDANDAVMDKIIPFVPLSTTLRIESRTEKAPYAIVSSEGDVTTIENVLNTPI